MLRYEPDDPNRLDGDGSGIACPDLPAPKDLKPVVMTAARRPTPASERSNPHVPDIKDHEETRIMHPNHRPRTLRARGARRGGERGFTLIELLVVITILGILAGIVVFAVQGIGDKGKASAAAADAAVLRAAEEANCAQHGSYEDLAGLKANGLVSSTKAINSIALGGDDRCGTGPKSSFSLYDASAPTDFYQARTPSPSARDPRTWRSTRRRTASTSPTATTAPSRSWTDRTTR